jgi:hypothetical protein
MVEKLHTPLPLASSTAAKEQHYQTVVTDIKNVLQSAKPATNSQSVGLCNQHRLKAETLITVTSTRAAVSADLHSQYGCHPAWLSPTRTTPDVADASELCCICCR